MNRNLKRIIPRDLSWLLFNERVLQEARDDRNPLIERFRFLGIFSSNMDEFYRVRFASLQRLMQLSDAPQKRLGNRTAAEVLHEVSEKVRELQVQADEIHDELIQELESNGINIIDETELTSGQKDYVRKYFVEKVSPSVITLILKDKDSFPELRDKSIYLAIKVVNKDPDQQPHYALIEIPSDLVGRFVELPKYGNEYVMYLEDLIRQNLEYIFFIYDFECIEAHTIKITRDAELDLDDDVSKGFLEKIERSLKKRKEGDPVRFVYDEKISPDTLEFLMEGMGLDNQDSLIAGGRYHNKKDYNKFPNLGGKELEFEPLPAMQHPDLDLDRSLLDVIRQKDVLLFLPYHTFSYFIRFLREAAIDPAVVSIQATLYRAADNSRVISALVNAAKNGKDVTVVIELRARFDEAANIKWTEELQAEGVHVIFGVPGLKVHSKMCLIRRKTEDGFEHFASIGTGNFNESTARYYTDYHLLTSNKEIISDVKSVFDFLKTNYKVSKYRHLIVSPHYTRKSFIRLIENEIENAKRGIKAGITIKLNSLSDVKLIEKLYEASSYGVKIRLIIRGICSLIPGVKGLSENIEAISILDRFLEHSRVLIFENGGDARYFISSADWMPRNLDFRVEVTTPILDDNIKRQLRDHIDIIWKDNVKSRWHNSHDKNEYRSIKGPKIRSQYALHEYVMKQLRLGK